MLPVTGEREGTRRAFSRAMRRIVPAFLLASLGALNGCYTTDDAARIRASNEFQCPEDRVRVTPRDDIETYMVDIDACGKRARYTCPHSRNSITCVREPLY
jgi:hypothetical protein